MPNPLDVLRIHPNDNVCVTLHPLSAGAEVVCGSIKFLLVEDLRLGAKLALMAMPAGTMILKFGKPIGSLSEDVALGGYVHTHNLKSDYLHHA